MIKGSKFGIVTGAIGSIGETKFGGYYGYKMSKTAANSAGKVISMDWKTRPGARPFRQRTLFFDHPRERYRSTHFLKAGDQGLVFNLACTLFPVSTFTSGYDFWNFSYQFLRVKKGSGGLEKKGVPHIG